MLSCGIVGLANVGKSTLFNAILKKQQALVANYPFATIEPNIGVVSVPDERLNKLADLVAGESQPDGFAAAELTRRVGRPPIVSATVRFVDIAGLVKGASQGEGLGNQFLSHIREVDAIVQVVRNFNDENIIRSGSVSPASDVETVNTELILADLQTVNKRLEASGNRKQVTSDKYERQQISNAIIDKVQQGLNQGRLISQINLNEEEKLVIKELNLVTAKPFIYVLNSDEGKVAELSSSRHPEQPPHSVILSETKDLDFPPQRDPASAVASGRTPQNDETGKQLFRDDVIYISAKLEAELSALSEAEQRAYLSELNITESGLDKVIKKAYGVLGLITFLTAGPKEVKAWTLRRGSTALRASGVIHSDFERGFIAVDVISADDLLDIGSYRLAREKGKIRLEGKEYVIQDGDVVEFRFSV